MTVTPIPTPAPAETSRGKFHEDAGPYRGWAGWGTVSLATAVNSIDALLAKGTFDVAVRDLEAVSWMLAVFVTIAASMLAFGAGKELRKGNKIRLAISAGWWALLGLAMATVRFAPPLLEGYPPEPGEMLIAGFMLVVYGGAGWKLMQAGNEMHNPMLTQFRQANRAERRAAKRLAKLEAEYARVNGVLADWPDRDEKLAEAANDLKEQAATASTELKQRARLEVAAILERVEGTSVYRQETWPEPPPAEEPTDLSAEEQQGPSAG